MPTEDLNDDTTFDHYEAFLVLEEPEAANFEFKSSREEVSEFLRDGRPDDELAFCLIRDMTQPIGRTHWRGTRYLIRSAVEADLVTIDVEQYWLDDILFGIGVLRKEKL